MNIERRRARRSLINGAAWSPRLGLICHADKDDDPPGGGEQAEKIKELEEALEAAKGKLNKAVDESKSEREKRKERDARLAELEAKEKEREEEAAKKRGEFEKLAEKEKAEKKDLQKKLDDALKDNALTSAIAASGVGDAYHGAVKAMFRDKLKVEGENVTLDGKSPAEALKAWAGSDEGKAFVPNGSSGAGAGGGGGGGNTGADDYKKSDGSANLTKLGELKRSDPEKAKTIAKELGVPLS